MKVIVRNLGRTEYGPVPLICVTSPSSVIVIPRMKSGLPSMRRYSPRVRRAKRACFAPGDIPVIQSDRVVMTYHGPGQITGYLMFDLRRMGMGVRDLVTGIEESMIETIAQYGISGEPRADAPGVYVGGDKIGSLDYVSGGALPWSGPQRRYGPQSFFLY